MSRELPGIIKVKQRDKSGKETSLLVQFPVNGHFQIGVYQGLLPSSEYDILEGIKKQSDLFSILSIATHR